MKSKIKVAVLMGGRSSEREVSLASGQEVIKNLDPKKFETFPVIMEKTGLDWFDKIRNINPDVVFIALHGPFGEDGTLQGMLEFAGLKYTGPGVLASAVGMDKLMFRKVMIAEKIAIPKFISLRKNEEVKLENFPGPYFVKPNSEGSSVGASIAKTKEDLQKSLDLAFKYDETVLVDEYLKGIEVTCGILGNEQLEVLPIVEIVPKGTFFDYESKYSDGGASEIAPARLTKDLTEKIQRISEKVYKAVGATGFSRIDFILENGVTPYVLEINTIPGLTSASLLPKAAKAAGITFSALIEKIIKYATE